MKAAIGGVRRGTGCPSPRVTSSLFSEPEDYANRQQIGIGRVQLEPFPFRARADVLRYVETRSDTLMPRDAMVFLLLPDRRSFDLDQ